VVPKVDKDFLRWAWRLEKEGGRKVFKIDSGQSKHSKSSSKGRNKGVSSSPDLEGCLGGVGMRESEHIPHRRQKLCYKGEEAGIGQKQLTGFHYTGARKKGILGDEGVLDGRNV